MFLLIFHFRNFNTKEEKEVAKKEVAEEDVQQVRGKSAEGYLDFDFVAKSESPSSAELKQNDCQQLESAVSLNRNDSCLESE